MKHDDVSTMVQNLAQQLSREVNTDGPPVCMDGLPFWRFLTLCRFLSFVSFSKPKGCLDGVATVAIVTNVLLEDFKYLESIADMTA